MVKEVSPSARRYRVATLKEAAPKANPLKKQSRRRVSCRAHPTPRGSSLRRNACPHRSAAPALPRFGERSIAPAARDALNALGRSSRPARRSGRVPARLAGFRHRAAPCHPRPPRLRRKSACSSWAPTTSFTSPTASFSIPLINRVGERGSPRARGHERHELLRPRASGARALPAGCHRAQLAVRAGCARRQQRIPPSRSRRASI